VPTGRRVRSHTMSMFSFLATGIKKYYDIGETLGKGSFAVVKKGMPKEGGPPVAVKIVDKKDAQFDEASLQQEIAIMRKVVHPNCIRLVEVFDEKAKMYIVVELVTGGELFDRIINRGHYSEKDAATLMCEVATAIDYLHSLGIVHRDLKPENLLYSSGDEGSPDYNVIKVADFGLAKVLTGGAKDGGMSTTCGTPGYVAPEVLEQNARGYGPEVDAWSLGVILYILLCGFPPFYDESNAVLFQLIKKGSYTFPSPYWDDVSESAKDLVHKLLTVDPKKRATVKDVLSHPWVAGKESQNAKALAMQGEQLKKYVARGRFKKAINTVVAVNKMKTMGLLPGK
jgi:calcium/calmodulin-dependent protein kinase I